MLVNKTTNFYIESLGIKEEWVYDIEVEDTHNFFANNILVHNSNYLSFHELFEHLNIKLLDSGGNITNEAWNIIKEYDDYINDKITEYAKAEFNSKDPRFVFKREVIADKGFFITKKRYAVHVIDDEGKKVKKLKFKGIDIVRNTMPEKLKPMAKEWLECMVVERDRLKCNHILKNIFNQMQHMPIDELSFSINCSNLEKYTFKPGELLSNKKEFSEQKDRDFEVRLHCPFHIKASHAYNTVLKKLNLMGKYENIKSGDKVKIIYVKEDNKFGIKCLAYKTRWPEEFNSIFKIDYTKLYDKIINSMVERFYEIVMWNKFEPTKSCKTDLFDFLS